MLEKTFFMIKPDGVARGLENEVFSRVEKAELKILLKRLIFLTEELAKALYLPHFGKPFYAGLIKFITSGPVIVSLLEGEDAINKVRLLMGATDPRSAGKGTIRGDLKEENILSPEGIMKNIVHGSDGAESARRELAIFFKEKWNEN
ncbi:MAG: nucleoside-diphosphate kinase [Candidatus Margulisbacteria bacterium]|nr:nucleoside-diphosphate kinase [Candidatus Margulisiibacteriota bacterium]